MSCWNKEQLKNMLEDVINELELSDIMIEKHGPLGTPPAELVRLVLDRKDLQIRMLRQGFVEIGEVKMKIKYPIFLTILELLIDILAFGASIISLGFLCLITVFVLRCPGEYISTPERVYLCFVFIISIFPYIWVLWDLLRRKD